jgi:hypothetical protein
MDDFDEVNTIGTVNFTSCSSAEPHGIEISVCEAWDDTTPRRLIVLCVSAGLRAHEFCMDVDKAEALGLLLQSAAREMRRMAKSLDEDNEEEQEDQ